jgi:hypothetical protein
MKKSLVALFALWGSLCAQEMPYGVVFPLQWEVESGIGRPDLATYEGGNFLACWESWGEDWDGRDGRGVPQSSGIFICRIEVQSPGGGMYSSSIKICVVK